MRTLMISLLLGFVATMPAAAQDQEAGSTHFFAEVQASSHKATRLVAYGEKNFASGLGLYVVLDKESDGYAEGYGGVKYEFAEGLVAGVAVGRENRPNSLRRNAFVSYDRGPFSAYASFENGGSGPWHKVTAVYKMNDRIAIGLMNESELGTGPRIEFSLAKDTPIWIALFPRRGFAAGISTYY
jgi:hypothetical protein